MKIAPRFAAALLSLALTASGCSQVAHAQGPEDLGRPVEERNGELFVPERSPLRDRLAVSTVSAKPVRHALEVPASAEADPARITRIPAPLPGRVVKLLARLGETVLEGTPLFTLDSPDLAAAQSDYLKAKSAEALAARGLSRQRDLSLHGIGAQRELEQAESDRDQALSELSRATTRLQLLGVKPGDGGRTLTVRSPIAGRVIDLATAAGQYQGDPAAVLMVVADLSTIWVTAQVPEKDLQRVAVGDEATVQFNAYPGERFGGRVLLVGDVLAPETRTVKVRIALGNAGHRLKPGMFATVGIMGKEKSELLVPASALVVRGDRSFVLVEKALATFERRPVELGEPVAAGVPVTRGLLPGERIVTADAILFP